MTIFERDKERGGGIVLTMPTTSDAGAVKNRPAPKGEAHLDVICGVAPPRHSLNYASSSRLASDIHLGFQNAYYLGEGQ